MTADVLTDGSAAKRVAETSPLVKARVAGVFYLVNVVASLYAFFPA